MTALREDVYAETCLLPHCIRTVARSILEQIFCQPAIAINDVESDRLSLKRRQSFNWRIDAYTDQLAGSFDLKRLIDGYVQIRHVLLRIEHRSKDVIQFGFCH